MGDFRVVLTVEIEGVEDADEVSDAFVGETFEIGEYQGSVILGRAVNIPNAYDHDAIR